LDIIIYAIGLLVPFLLTLMALLVDLDAVGDYLLAGFAAMGGVVGVYFFLGVGSDGDLVSGSTLLTSAATATALTWQFVVMLPMVFSLMAFCAGIYRAWKGFK
jgi:hypothetical protein